ncbi:MAG: hypothetical protein PHV37_05695 [Candidatus Gastranaerophilales bacterium]|nr:hypothetical protein [Candidatus Gastranaerophilales bacterium]
MLNGINNSTDLQKQQVSQTTGMDKTGILGKSNPFEKIDKNLLVDELDISQNAFKLYEKDLDIKKFTKLAISDPENNSHNSQVAEKIASGDIQFDDNEIINSLFNNNKFLNDLIGQ